MHDIVEVVLLEGVPQKSRFSGACRPGWRRIFAHHAFGVILLQPCFRGVVVGENLKMIDVANLLA
jgi:hypothetical protein